MTNVSKLGQFLILVISKTDKTILFVIFMLGRSQFLWLFGCLCAERQCYLIYKSILVVILEKKVFVIRTCLHRNLPNLILS